MMKNRVFSINLSFLCDLSQNINKNYPFTTAGCMMNKKILVGFSFAISLLLLLSGCTTPDNSETLYVIQYPFSEKIAIENNTLLDDYNVSTNLDTSFFYSNSTIEDIVDYYLVAENIENWELNRSKIYAEPDPPIIISYGHVKLKSDSTGAYIFVILNNNTIPIDADVIIGIASGNWNLVEIAGI